MRILNRWLAMPALLLIAGTAAAQTDPPTPAAKPAAAILPADLSVAAMFQHADVVVRTVLIALIVASVVTWTVLLAKGISIFTAQRAVRRALAQAETERTFAPLHTGMARLPSADVRRLMIEATSNELQLSTGQDPSGIKERVASRLHRLEIAAGRRIARGTGMLATIGATAPFIGLFGTVWGIMNSFVGIAQSHTTNLAVVAPGIAEALLATATGLAAAIPAVVIYNIFARAIGGYRASLSDLSASILRLISRELDRGGIPRLAPVAADAHIGQIQAAAE